jgi:hypothetical protein
MVLIVAFFLLCYPKGSYNLLFLLTKKKDNIMKELSLTLNESNLIKSINKLI